MATGQTTLTELYPEIEPFNSGLLRVSDLHQIYYEESGKKDGKPVIFCKYLLVNLHMFADNEVNLRHFRVGLDLAFGRTEQRNREIKPNYGTFDPRNL